MNRITCLARLTTLSLLAVPICLDIRKINCVLYLILHSKLHYEYVIIYY